MEPPKVNAISGCLLVVALVVACVGLAFFALDRVCLGALGWRIPVHPDGQIVRQSHNFLTPNGMGQTVTVVYIPTNEDDIQRWVNRQIGQKGVEATERSELAFYYRIARLAIDVGPADDGIGSQVIFIASCFQ